jgi:hypothetical protein
MKRRTLEEQDDAEIRRLFENENFRYLFERWVRDEYKTDFKLHELPTEVLINIVNRHIDTLLAIFEINKQLWEIQAVPGFWVELFKLTFPGQAAALALFLRESPELGVIYYNEIRYLIEVTLGTRVWISGSGGVLSSAESLLQNGRIEEALQTFYQARIRDQSYSTWVYSADTKMYEVIMRRYLLRLFALWHGALLSDPNELINFIRTQFPETKIEEPPFIVSYSFLVSLFDSVQEHLKTRHLKRLQPFIAQVQTLKRQFELESILYNTTNAKTGELDSIKTI